MTPTDLYSCERGTAALVLSIPHSGRRLPLDLEERLAPAARNLPDTDWRVDELYDFARDLGATVVKANYSRYVVDLNRPPLGESLYPDRPATGLCPTRRFDGQAVYRRGQEPDAAEIEQRRVAYWQPYHDRLEAELASACERHGRVLLYDCHSIDPVVPRLFDGHLPMLNVGTNHGSSCAAAIQDAAVREVVNSGYTFAVNGRFVGGHITRHYGQPKRGRHALQMEIAYDAYLDGATPATFNPRKANDLATRLQRILTAALAALMCLRVDGALGKL